MVLPSAAGRRAGGLYIRTRTHLYGSVMRLVDPAGSGLERWKDKQVKRTLARGEVVPEYGLVGAGGAGGQFFIHFVSRG